jgi:predicted phage tail protein
LYQDDLKEMQQALTPGTSALLALLAPEQAAIYALRIADFGGETMRFSLTNDAGQEFQDAKHAFIARQAERRREQLAAWSSTTTEETTDLDAMNLELEQSYAAMSSTPDWQQTDLGAQAAALRTRRDAARELLNQTLAAEVQRLDEVIARYQEAIPRATSEDERAALTSQQAALRNERRTAQQQLAASQEAELEERWRDISALEGLAAGADRATRIELDLLLAQLRDAYAAARQVRSSPSAA